MANPGVGGGRLGLPGGPDRGGLLAFAKSWKSRCTGMAPHQKRIVVERMIALKDLRTGPLV